MGSPSQGFCARRTTDPGSTYRFDSSFHRERMRVDVFGTPWRRCSGATQHPEWAWGACKACPHKSLEKQRGWRASRCLAAAHDVSLLPGFASELMIVMALSRLASSFNFSTSRTIPRAARGEADLGLSRALSKMKMKIKISLSIRPVRGATGQLLQALKK